MSAGSPAARGLVAPEAREALLALDMEAMTVRLALMRTMTFTGQAGYTHDEYDEAMAALGRLLSTAKAELERPAAENRSLNELVDGLMDDKVRLAAEVERLRGAAQYVISFVERRHGPLDVDYEPVVVLRAALAGDTGEAGA